MLGGSRLSVTDIRGAVWSDMIGSSAVLRHKHKAKEVPVLGKLKREVVIEAAGGVREVATCIQQATFTWSLTDASLAPHPVTVEHRID